MIITKKALPRRTFLRGMGATLALPLLDAMVPSMTAWAATPANPVRRLGFVYMPMGCNISQWTPPGSSNLAELSPSLRSLASVVDHLTVISNMELKNAYPGTHATSNASFLSAATAKWTESSDYHLATTADQIAAQQIGGDTRLPSLELAMDLLTTVGQCDNGYACVYQNNLSWSSPTTPLPAEAHPRVAFERLFGEGGSAADRRAELRKNSSLLDWVSEDISRLQKKLGPSDRTKVTQYLDTVREVERRIQKAETATADSKLPDLDRPVGVPASYADDKTSSADHPAKYVVKEDDTFRSIAKAHGTTSGAIAKANPDVDPDRLRPGLKLVLPVKPAKDSEDTEKKKDATTSGEEKPPAKSQGTHHYVIGHGEDAESIADAFGISVKQLCKINGGKAAGSFKAGSEILVPNDK